MADRSPPARLVVGCGALLLIGLACTTWMTSRQASDNDAVAAERFHSVSAGVESRLMDRLARYQYGLRGARGAILTAGPELISRHAFRAYHESRDLNREFPGARGFGFIRRVEPAKEAQFLNEARWDGWPDFSIRQLSAHEGERYVIQYIEPIENNRAAVGLDIASDPTRRAAAQQAMRSGQATLTSPITLVQASHQVQRSFLLLLPIYHSGQPTRTPEQREAATYGWAYAPLLIDEVIGDIGVAQADYDLALFDAPPDRAPEQFFGDKNPPPPDRGLRQQLRREVFGRPWLIDIRATPGFVASLHLLSPRTVFIAGSAATLLLVALVYANALDRHRRRQLREFNATLEEQVHERTLQLAAAHRHLQAILDGLPPMVTYWDKDLVNRFANRPSREWFGVGTEGMAGVPMRQLLGDDMFERNRVYVEGVLRGEPQSFERSIQRPHDPAIRHTQTHYMPDLVDGQVRGFYVLVHDVTDQVERQQQLEVVLRESQALLQTIQMHSIYSVADAAGNIIDVNEAFCRISGYAREELIGRNHRIVNSGVHPRMFWSNMWRTISRGRSWRSEVCNRAKDGSLYWVDSVIAPFIGPQGQIEKYVSLRTDVTATRFSTEALIQERERLDNILAGTHAGTWEWNIPTGEARFNERWAEIMGYSLKELAPVSIHTWVDLCHPEDLQRANDLLARHFSGELPYFECEARMRHKDGHWVWVLDRGRVLRWDDHNEPVWMAGTQLDITERKLADERLRATSEAFLERAGRVAGVGGWELDVLSGEMTLTSQTRRIYELPEHQSVALEDTFAFYDPSVQATIRAAFSAAMAHGEGWDMELPFITAGGRHLWVRSVGEAERDDDDTGQPPVRLIGALQDVTAKHVAQEALRQAMLAAEAASSAKSEFLANMSHEIRTPLNAVIGLSSLLVDTTLNHEQQHFVTQIQSAGKALLGVINDVLDLSKIEAGELTMDPAPFRLSGLLKDIEELFRLGSRDRSITFLQEVAPGLPDLLVGDVTRLRQVLINLLGNAFKFTEHGSVTLSVQELQRTDTGVVLRCAVKDTGLGMSPEVLSRLFTPFMQADASTTRRFGGTGLGLSIAQRLVSLMGGEVGVHSTEGQGSEFWFQVPLALAQDAPEALLSEHLSDMSGVFWLHGVRVLVVDDSDINREVAQRILAREGAQVELARNGQEALDRLAQDVDAFDAVLMDVQMPVMDGHEATRRLREDLGLKSLPVIALTAGALVSERQRAYDSGVNDFVSKPFDPPVLVRTVRSNIERATGIPLPLVARATAEVPAAATWPEVEGLDGAGVASRLGGDTDLLASMLDRWLREFGDLCDGAVPQDAEGRVTLARRLHKLRGSAGMLGADAVNHQAALLEDALKQGQAGVELDITMRALGSAIHALELASASLRSGLAGGPIAAPATSTVPAPAQADVAALAMSLLHRDLAAVQQFQALSPGLRVALGDDTFGRLRMAMSDLDFDAALALLPCEPREPGVLS